MRYVILKADLDTLRVRGDVLGDTPDNEALRGVELSVEAHELTPSEVRDVRRAPEVLEAVPSVPMQLVSPSRSPPTNPRTRMPPPGEWPRLVHRGHHTGEPGRRSRSWIPESITSTKPFEG